jgi:hypothetical protein
MRYYLIGLLTALFLVAASVVWADVLSGPVGFIDPATAGRVKLDTSGCYAIKLKNSSGATRVQGTVVEADAQTDGSFDIAAADATDPIGVLLDASCANAADCWVCVGGRVKVLLKDSTACTREYWCGVSDATGRAPGAVAGHFRELGHAIESVGAGSDKLCEIIMHFL